MAVTKVLKAVNRRLSHWAPDPDLHLDLVRALYATPKSIAGAAVVALSVMGVAAVLSGAPIFLGLFGGFLLLGLARTLGCLRFNALPAERQRAELRLWEGRALAGAWGFASLVGVSGAYAVTAHAGSEIEILVACATIGYVAGISSRNASRPLITIGQISLTCVPFSLALLSRLDLVHTTLAGFIFALQASTIVICRSIYENIVLRHRAQSKIEKLALKDTLTDLWNRSAFLERVEQALMQARRFGLVAIDLDHFKDVNDTLGHPAGDEVLRVTADRIRTAAGAGAEIARIGGDEFLVMVPDGTPHGLDLLSRRIGSALGEPITIDMTQVQCGASLGFALVEPDGTASLDEVMRQADLALYAAKKAGGCQIVPFSRDLSSAYDERMQLLTDLQSAYADGQLHLVYQPIVDPRSGRTVACEALLRWTHPQRGAIPPSVFVPIAETTGLIVPIGAWVLEAACREAMAWDPEIKVAVNLSAMQFQGGRELIQTVMSALLRSGLPAARLELEITETILIEDTAATLRLIHELRALGIGVSLDDFGTGFSSLGYLHDFPFSKVKIDRKFSQNVVTSSRAAAIVRGIVRITRDLRMELVAEGIESHEQLQHMQSLGIQAIQGYYFSRPLPPDLLREAIRNSLKPALQRKRAREDQGQLKSTVTAA